MTDNEITMTSAEFETPKKRKAIYPHIVVGGKADDPSYSIHWYDVKEGRMIEGYSSFSLKFVHEWLEECFEVVEDDIEPLINRQKAEVEKLELLNGILTASCDGYIKAIELYKAEIERLMLCINELKHEVGRHERNYDPSEGVDNLINSIIQPLSASAVAEMAEKAIENQIKFETSKAKIKSEAYREFAESLEKKSTYSALVNADIVYKCDINKVLKELEGDNVQSRLSVPTSEKGGKDK